jgi:hypothetical protein
MSDQSFERWEAKLHDLARHFPYPPAPDIASTVNWQSRTRSKSTYTPEGTRRSLRRRLVWAMVIVLFILSGLLTVPQVRAAVVEFLQLGAIRIFLAEPTPTATPSPVTPQPEATPTATSRPSATREPVASPAPTHPYTPTPPSPPLAAVLDLAGETIFTEAQEQAGFPLRLPAYPPDLGPPDRVFYQDLGGPVVVLVWLDDHHPDRVRLSLHYLGPGTFAWKIEPQFIQETTVHGERAYWTAGPYLLLFQRDYGVEPDLGRLVEGHVLLWEEGEITYRLETDLPLEEAVRIVESLR